MRLLVMYDLPEFETHMQMCKFEFLEGQLSADDRGGEPQLPRAKGYTDRFGTGESTLIGIAVDREARLVKAHRMERI